MKNNKIIIEEFEVIQGHVCVSYQIAGEGSGVAHIVKDDFDKWLVENGKLELVQDTCVLGEHCQKEFTSSLEEYYDSANFNEFNINSDLRDYIYEKICI